MRNSSLDLSSFPFYCGPFGNFFNCFLILPALSDAALLMPAVVPESDWDCDELPAASSLLDA